MDKKARAKIVITFIFLIGILISFVVAEPTSSNKLENTFGNLGVTGMKLNSFEVDGISITDLSEERTGFIITNEFKGKIKKDGKIKQDIWLKNKGANKDFSFSTIIEIDYSEIRWDGTRYALTTTPVHLTSWYDEDGIFRVPNIFMDDEYNKRINY